MEEQMTVPYIVHESAMARSERHIRRLVIALIVAVVMIAVRKNQHIPTVRSWQHFTRY